MSTSHSSYEHIYDEPVLYPVSYLREPPWYDFVRHNGYTKLAKRLRIRIITQREHARMLWNEFSPKDSFYNLWQFRGAFLDGFGFEPYFIVLYEDYYTPENIVGVLTLWHETDAGKEKYAWCGYDWSENNVFFVKNPEVIPLLLMCAPSPLHLPAIRSLCEYNHLLDFPGFGLSKEKKYSLDLTRFRSIDDYLGVLKKKKRYNLRRDRKRIVGMKPTIITNNSKHLEQLFELNVRRLREKYPDHPSDSPFLSSFEDERAKNAFRALLGAQHPYKERLTTTIINGNVAAVEIGFVYNKTYFALCCGANITKYPGIGTFSNLLVLEDAIRMGCTTIDFMEGNYNWKESWQLQSSYQYCFKK